MEVYIIILLIYLALSFCIYIGIVKDKDKCALEYYGFVSKYLYNSTKMNWFGCIVSSVLLYILCPVFIFRSIGMFIYWVVHIGRK